VHSRIFQITTKPVQDTEFISESSLSEHWFVREIADTVSTDNDRTEDIRHLRSWLEPRNVAVFDAAGDSFTVLPCGAEAYFAGAYDAFIAARASTLSMGLADFAHGGEFSKAMRLMGNSFNDRFGYYVSSDEFETITFDEFIRSTEAGTRYFIGGTLDYHY